MNARVTAAEKAALPVARAALESRDSSYGIAESMVFALGAAQLLQSPETAAELVALRARVAELEQRLVPLPDYRLNGVRARVEAATAGPWCTDDWEIYQGAEYVPGVSEWIGETCRAEDSDGARADAAFIAAARTDVPLLLDHVRVLEHVLADAEARVKELEAERHSTNEALDEAVGALREKDARIAELEQNLRAARQAESEQHDDLAGALGYPHEDWADLISIAAANTAALARSGGDR